MNQKDKTKYIVQGNKKYAFRSKSYKINSRKETVVPIDDEIYSAQIEKKKFTGKITKSKHNKISVMLNGNTYNFTIDREKTFKRKVKSQAFTPDSVSVLKSPMPGKICDILVSKGDKVKKGEPLLILEAMKMQNQLLALFDCEVTNIHVKENDIVMGDQLLVELKK